MTPSTSPELKPAFTAAMQLEHDIAEAEKALRCLYIAVEESVARDVSAKLSPVILAAKAHLMNTRATTPIHNEDVNKVIQWLEETLRNRVDMHTGEIVMHRSTAEVLLKCIKQSPSTPHIWTAEGLIAIAMQDESTRYDKPFDWQRLADAINAKNQLDPS